MEEPSRPNARIQHVIEGMRTDELHSKEMLRPGCGDDPKVEGFVWFEIFYFYLVCEEMP